jgi:hypothetical protein
MIMRISSMKREAAKYPEATNRVMLLYSATQATACATAGEVKPPMAAPTTCCRRMSCPTVKNKLDNSNCTTFTNSDKGNTTMSAALLLPAKTGPWRLLETDM